MFGAPPGENIVLYQICTQAAQGNTAIVCPMPSITMVTTIINSIISACLRPASKASVSPSASWYSALLFARARASAASLQRRLPRVVVKEADIGDADDDVDNRRDCENDYGDYK